MPSALSSPSSKSPSPRARESPQGPPDPHQARVSAPYVTSSRSAARPSVHALSIHRLATLHIRASSSLSLSLSISAAFAYLCWALRVVYVHFRNDMLDICNLLLWVFNFCFCRYRPPPPPLISYSPHFFVAPMPSIPLLWPAHHQPGIKWTPRRGSQFTL